MRRFTAFVVTTLMAFSAAMGFNARVMDCSDNSLVATVPATGQVALLDAAEPQPMVGAALDRPSHAAAARVTAGTRAITSVADIAGEYVMAYESAIHFYLDGGVNVTVSAIAGTDSVLMTNFWDVGRQLKARVDLDEMKLYIPNQVIGTSSTYGDYDIAVSSTAGVPDRTATIEAAISADGVITIDQWWGVFIVSGSSADYYYGIYSYTEMEQANATMSQTLWYSSTGSELVSSYSVLVTQPAANVLTVKNFGNAGRTVEIMLESDSTAYIPTQIVDSDGTYGYWYSYGAVYGDDYSLSSTTPTIYCDKATGTRAISWGNWMIRSGNYYTGVLLDGKIETTADIDYPVLEFTPFEGSGTESDPYLLKTLSDMVQLADSVNNCEDLDYGTSSAAFARVYLGQYFRLANDIDMSYYRLTPIGCDWEHTFAGTFDGNGKTLTGLQVNTWDNGYAGLFGKCDTACVISSLTIVDPQITTDGYYAGAVAGYMLGTVENCNVTGGTITNSTTGTGGIAGYSRTIADCSVADCQITAEGSYTGGITGQSNEGISGCSVVNTTITGAATPIGGIVSTMASVTVEDCYFTGVIDASTAEDAYVGGIAGYCYGGTVKRCFSSAQITTYGEYAATGGIVGYHAGTITDCYSNSSISNSTSQAVGGISGALDSYISGNRSYTSTVTSCYTASNLDISSTSYDTTTDGYVVVGQIASYSSPTLENIYYDSQIIDFGDGTHGLTTAQLTSASGLDGFDSSVWTFTEGYYPRLTASAETEAAKLSASALQMTDDSSLGNITHNITLSLLGSTTAWLVAGGEYTASGTYASISGDTVVIGTESGTETLWLVNSTAGARYYTLDVSPITYPGTGTENDPYLISTKADLINLSERSSGDGQTYPGKYFLMTCDIDLENDEAFTGICCTGSYSSSSARFAGVFDGGGHTLHNMKLLSSVTWSVKPEDDSEGLGTISSGKNGCGFIGLLDTSGVLKNLTIASDCDATEMYATAGVLVGVNYGLVDSCLNYAAIVGQSSSIGGIVGRNESTGTVSSSYNAGSVTTGYQYAGGIAGYNAGLIENCQNTGEITAKRISRFLDADETSRLLYVGGIAGYMTGGRISSCLNAATITAYGRAGGLAGTLHAVTSSTATYGNDVIGSINYGTVITTSLTEVGAIGGYTGTTGELADNYYDGQITLNSASGGMSLNGTTAAETSTLISGTALENYSTDIWDFTAGSYPSLKAFAADSAAQILRSIIIDVASGETVQDLTTDVGLGTANGCSWTLADGTNFKIDSGKLIVPDTASNILADTLIATVGSYVKMFPVKKLPAMPLQGKGTADNPYLINDTTDWNALAGYISDCADGLSGRHAQITADIDFTDGTIVPLGYDRSVHFDGYLDGNGKTIKGVSATADAAGYGAVVHTAGENAHIYDLTVEGSLTTSYKYSGGVVGYLYGTLENVTSRMTVTSTASYTAGLLAVAQAGSTLTDCVNEGTVSSSATYTAGLVAYSYRGVTYDGCANKGTVTYTGSSAKCYAAGVVAYAYSFNMTDCYNEAAVSATSTSSGAVGGILAYSYSTSSDTTKHYMKGCYNTGDISGSCGVAGIGADGANSSKFYMEDCYNTGNITSTATTTKYFYTAGVATDYYRGSTYRNCWNSGTVTSNKLQYTGGVFGENAVSGNPTYIIGCYNTGEVVGAGTYVGGVVAKVHYYTYLDSCYNTGAVSGPSYVGGVAGRLYGAGNAKMSNCYNTGTVTASESYAGGIVGASTYKDTIDCCFNCGQVTATTSYAGGVAGLATTVTTNVYNTGTITGGTLVGGLIGAAQAGDYTELHNSYSTGTVACSGENYGDILGHGTDNTTYWGAGNSMSGTYYLASNATYGSTDTISQSVTSTQLAALDLGDSWNAVDDYTYPLIATLDGVDYALIDAVQVVPADGDSLGFITQDFHVGAPDGVIWTASSPALSFDGNTVTFTESIDGTVTLTATAGELSRDTEIYCCVEVVGIEDTGRDNRTLVGERFYTPTGLQVADPTGNARAIYIIVKTYDDGTTETVKEAR